MPAPPVQPIVIWFGRVGDLILLSALLEILHRRFGSPCHVIGAGAWLGEIYAAHADVARVSCLHRYTAWAFDPTWWRTRRALRASRAGPVYVCETDLRKLARIRRLLRFSGIEAARCVFLAQTDLDTAQPPTSKVAPTHRVDAQTDLDTALPHTSKIAPTHWVDRLVSFGRLTPAAFNAADYPWPAPAPRCAPLLTVSDAARAECAAWLERQGWRDRTLILVQPGNRRTMRGRRLRVLPADDKAWPLERWAGLLHRIHARLPQALIVLCGAPRESRLLEWIAAAAQLPAVAAAELRLPRLLALCARSHSMISVDTGPAHAAAALGLPLVVLFGAHSQQQWLPRSPCGSPVLGVGGPPQSTRLDQISVETVFAAWCALDAQDNALRTAAARATAP
ncbi:MAG: glycosyltransferase family 9 protein [Gammaproteobacteria bacterium]|nr:MAG: glycosyltransferase family 9 protein [Gammaproteobacteria bacterium]